MTILDTGQWKVRDLVMGPGTEYRVASNSSFFTLTTRADESQNHPYGHGGIVGSEWANPRVVPIRVFIDTVEHTELSWVDAIEQLAAAFQPVGSTGEIVELYRNISGREFLYLGRTRLIDPDEDIAPGGYGWVQLAFEAADPRRYSAEASTVSTGLAVQEGGLTIPAQVASTQLALTGASGSYGSTPNHASLQITGDLDMRVDADLPSWATGSDQTLLARYVTTGNQRSYRLRLNSTGTLRLTWSTDGTAVLNADSSAAVPITSGRLAVRATIDVDNGAAQRVVTFYTAPTIAGPWTQLGTNTPVAGATSIHAGTAPLEVGSVDNGTAVLLTGNVLAAQVYSGIAGTLAANPDFTSRTPWVTSFADSTGKTWTVNGAAKLRPRTFQGGLRLPFMVPGRLGGGSMSFVNLGTAAAPFTARIDGPAVEPWVLVRQPDGTTQSIRFDLTLEAGQWITLGSATRQALLNDSPSSNQRGRATWLIDPDPVLPGVTTFRFGAAEYHSAAQLTVTARSAWW